MLADTWFAEACYVWASEEYFPRLRIRPPADGGAAQMVGNAALLGIRGWETRAQTTAANSIIHISNSLDLPAAIASNGIYFFVRPRLLVSLHLLSLKHRACKLRCN